MAMDDERDRVAAERFFETARAEKRMDLERLLVDYRLYLYSTRRQRRENFVKFFDTQNFEERWKEIPEPNTYLKFFYRRYQRYKAYLSATA